MSSNNLSDFAASAPPHLTRPGRLAWVDILRVVACVMVVVSHGCDAFVGQFDADRTMFLTGMSIGSLMRPSVPLFVMMTAILIMPLKPSAALGDFYRRRIGRIIVPLIFWSLALPLLIYFYFNSPMGSISATPLVDITGYTPEQLGDRLWNWVFNFNFDTIPLWYLYMLVGLYLIIPVIDGWVNGASKRDLQIFLWVWVITLLLPYLRLAAPLLGYTGNYGNLGLLGECDWNPYGTFYYVSGFIGYVVLARYLVRFPLEWSNARMCGVLIPMFIVGYAITFGGYVMFQNYFPGDYAYLEIVWYFCGINVVMMTFPMIAFMQRIKTKTAPRWVSQLAGLTFGIYLCHYLFEFVGYDLMNIPGLAPAIRIVGAALFSFVAAAAVTWLFKLTRPTSRLVS
ncbi:MAG: acyltransferase [Paramuribaculum sp.]|nr:acyltransferase [Paramuribaculum sp.]